MCMIEDSEPLDFCRTITRTARKGHVCSECGRTINSKERYTYSSFGKDGGMGINKRCLHCDVAANWLSRHCGGYAFDSIKEDLIEHYDSGYRKDGLQKILIGMNRKWQSFDNLALLPVLYFGD